MTALFENSSAILLVITLLAGLYMTWNIGANDVANAIGTSVGSGALALKSAVILAACFEFAGAFFFGSHVSHTIEEKIVKTHLFYHDPMILVYGMLSVLLAAGSWLLIASYFGLPVSTTHSIVGAMVGFGAAIGGIEAVYWENVLSIASSWVLSPILGGILSYSIFYLLRKRIFFVLNPVRAAKKIAPVIVFFFLMIFLMVFIFQHPDDLPLGITPSTGVILAFFVSVIGAIVYFIYYQQLMIPTEVAFEALPSQDILHELSKAKKYLKRVQAFSSGEMQDDVGKIVADVKNLSSQFQKTPQRSLHTPEFNSVEEIFSKLQWLSASLMAFSHGANDVANAIGPLSIGVTVLLTGEFIPDNTVSQWLLGLGGLGIVIGLATWGWRVIETIGRKITELTPTRGFSAELGASMTILMFSRLGFPISATHTLVGSVLGVGFARGIEALNLNTMRDIVLSWVVTIPVGAVTAIGFYFIINSLLG